MPRSREDAKPASFQLGKVEKWMEVQGIYIFGLSKLAPNYGRQAVHYFAAQLRDMRGKNFLARMVTEEAVLEIS
eukprot:5732494-Ditylum_brightwellii.AAC.1